MFDLKAERINRFDEVYMVSLHHQLSHCSL